MFINLILFKHSIQLSLRDPKFSKLTLTQVNDNEKRSECCVVLNNNKWLKEEVETLWFHLFPLNLFEAQCHALLFHNKFTFQILNSFLSPLWNLSVYFVSLFITNVYHWNLFLFIPKSKNEKCVFMMMMIGEIA